MKTTTIRYDELKKGDLIIWHGALERVENVEIFPAPANEYYPTEVTVNFTLHPYNKDSIRLLGHFYSHGTYGGVGCLLIEKVETL